MKKEITQEKFEIIIENQSKPYVRRAYEPYSKEWKKYIKQGFAYTIEVSKKELDFILAFEKKFSHSFIRVAYNPLGKTLKTKFTVLLKHPKSEKYVTLDLYKEAIEKIKNARKKQIA